MRDTGPRCKQCQRFSMKLCSRPPGKCRWERATAAASKFSVRRTPSSRVSQYGLQLIEKQKAKAIYGVMERQFRNYYREATRLEGKTGDNLLALLESRFDNVVFRLGFAHSRAQARQNINHGHFTINGSRVNVPSYHLKPGDQIKWREKSIKSPLFAGISEEASGANLPDWLKRSGDSKDGQIVGQPVGVAADLNLTPSLIVEYYSRR